MNKMKQMITASILLLTTNLIIAQTAPAPDDEGATPGTFACKHENPRTNVVDTYFLINENLGQVCPENFSCNNCDESVHDPDCRYYKEPLF